ncbi:MAG: hypothetical protein NTW29_18905 [Bacteroidetes bacterium]|nr:hypothetical protein [Bacteroidota bacterium]
MTVRKTILFFVAALLSFSLAQSQDKVNVKFGNVSPKDFETKVYAIDSNAQAVIIADVGNSILEGNNKGWFSLVFKRFTRIHILNKSAYDVADFSIPLYFSGEREEVLEKVKAVTYNLEGGKVVETKLDAKQNIFREKTSKNRTNCKFTLPNIKEGCIIEVEYTIKSDFLWNLQPFDFQGGYPRLWSEYNLSLPEFLGYVFLTQGYKKYDIYTTKDRMESFRVSDIRGVGASEQFQFQANVTDYRWVIKNVPALKEENFTSTINNHIAKIDFQLSEYRRPLEYRRIMGTWEKLAEELLRDEQFGLQLSRDNGWLREVLEPLKSPGQSKLDLANKIFNYVRDNFTVTGNNNMYTQQTLKNVVKSKSGSLSEINLLLTAMLRHEDINADPVILSTRGHGFTYSLYPVLDQYNYVICRTQIDDKQYFLDASEPRLGFGHLPLRCYNGHARVINKSAEAIELLADGITEASTTSLFIINDEKNNMVGSFQQTPGYYQSFSIRNDIKEKGIPVKQDEFKKGFGTDIAISNFGIDSLKKVDDPVNLHFDFDIKAEKEDVIYINPMFGEGYKKNPFQSAERAYPVEMNYAMDETYNLQMEIPNGYVVDELPQSVIVKLNEADEGIFEYRISQSGSGISFRSRIRIGRAFFMPEEYEMLREFFNLIVKKHAEQIVFKKKP